ncbi:MAG TPA: hypothetical protein VLJ86_22995 [Ramlibacter sp.]|nr:hypothetical protein [Ramlibacter sp.]
MLFNWLVRRHMAAFEKTFDYDMGYGRELLGWSRKGFWRFARLAGMAAYRDGVPLSTWYAVKLIGTRAEDCGPCTQLVVNMASREGVPADALRAVLRDDLAAMDADTALGYRYARAAIGRGADIFALRDEVLERFGPKAMASLALTLTGARMYPMLRYAMGHGHACVRVQVGNDTVVPAVMNNPAHAARV